MRISKLYSLLLLTLWTGFLANARAAEGDDAFEVFEKKKASILVSRIRRPKSFMANNSDSYVHKNEVEVREVSAEELRRQDFKADDPQVSANERKSIFSKVKGFFRRSDKEGSDFAEENGNADSSLIPAVVKKSEPEVEDKTEIKEDKVLVGTAIMEASAKPIASVKDTKKNKDNIDKKISYTANSNNIVYDPDMPEYRIRTGDKISISIPYEPDSLKSVPVRPDGRITYLFDIEVMAAGLTYKELNKILREKLSKYYKNPQVSVIGQSFAGNSVFVMGPVGKPGRHVIHNDSHLLDILSQSGAMSLLPQSDESGVYTRDIVDLESAYIARGDKILDINFKKLLIERDLTQNIILKPKDFIYIPSSLSTERKIFILGEVDEPTVYRYTGDVSFLEAITTAGGVNDGRAWVRRCFVIRGGIKAPKEIIKINYPDIVAGRSPDVQLHSGDMVYVPKTPLFYTSEIINSVLTPLRSLLELDNMGKNSFREGSRQWKDVIYKSRALGTY